MHVCMLRRAFPYPRRVHIEVDLSHAWLGQGHGYEIAPMGNPMNIHKMLINENNSIHVGSTSNSYGPTLNSLFAKPAIAHRPAATSLTLLLHHM